MHLQGIHVSPFNINKGFSIKRANLDLGECLKSHLTSNFATITILKLKLWSYKTKLLPKHKNGKSHR